MICLRRQQCVYVRVCAVTGEALSCMGAFYSSDFSSKHEETFSFSVFIQETAQGT